MGDLKGLPLVVYDGECAFCRMWVDYWRALAGEAVEFAPYQQAAGQHPDIPRQQFERAVWLILPDGQSFSAAQAVFRLLALLPGGGWPLALYRRVPLFAPAAEAAYRLVADHRDFFYRLTALLFGTRLEPPSYRLSRWLFLRALGVVYFFAFAALIPQMAGLYGSRGVLPIADFLGEVQGLLGPAAVWRLPTLFWLNSSDGFLTALPVVGVILACLLIAGVAQRAALVGLYALYLSLVSAGQDFMAFQWDFLLLEAGFLAIFLAPGHWLPRLPDGEDEPPRLFVWLVRWVLFRLILGSGMSKLLSGDPTWRDLTALSYHYFTQPLPNPAAWVMAQLPLEFQKASVVFTFAGELAAPFGIFLPRRLRFAGGLLMIILQALIFLTGNFTFFNLLTISLCLLVFDDAALRRLVPTHWREALAPRWQGFRRAAWKQAVRGLVGALILAASVAVFLTQLGADLPLPPPMGEGLHVLQSDGIVGQYGLFAVMTTERPEIVIEGSNDGVQWLPYEFRYKPGDLRRPPPVIAPFHPRLDWQMWFAALGDYRSSPWFVALIQRLLEGSPDVLGLLDSNPFPDHPPRFIRATLYRYQFTTFAERAATGAWWKRTPIGEYLPPVSLTP